jgi:hypothetical protein
MSQCQPILGLDEAAHFLRWKVAPASSKTVENTETATNGSVQPETPQLRRWNRRRHSTEKLNITIERNTMSEPPIPGTLIQGHGVVATDGKILRRVDAYDEFTAYELRDTDETLVEYIIVYGGRGRSPSDSIRVVAWKSFCAYANTQL